MDLSRARLMAAAVWKEDIKCVCSYSSPSIKIRGEYPSNFVHTAGDVDVIPACLLCAF